MTPQGARLIAIVSVLLLLELAWFQMARRSVDSGLKADAQAHGERVAALRQENRALQAAIRGEPAGPSAPAAGAGVEPSPGVLENLPVDRAARNRELLALVRSGLIGQFTYAAPSQFKVETKVNKLAEVLGLTPGETDTLRNAALLVSSTLLAAAEVRTDENGALRIEMKDAAQARVELERMRQVFRQVLGQDGYAIYEAMGFRTALENSLNNLGLTPYSMTVTKTIDEATQTPRYRMTNSTVGPAPAMGGGGGGGGRGGVAGGTAIRTVTGATRETLANQLGPLDSLVPPGF